jgi:hypothetical protein
MVNIGDSLTKILQTSERIWKLGTIAIDPKEASMVRPCN